MSRRWLLCVAAAAAVIALGACRERDPDAPLVGKWTSEVVDTEWGKAKLTYEFQRDSFEFWFAPQDGDTIRTSGKYSLQGDSIVWDEMNGGGSIRYTLDGDVLTLTASPGDVTRFRRK